MFRLPPIPRGFWRLKLVKICSVDTGVFPGTALPNCQFMADDIAGCQARGKLVTLSLGGATGVSTFTSDTDAIDFVSRIKQPCVV